MSAKKRAGKKSGPSKRLKAEKPKAPGKRKKTSTRRAAPNESPKRAPKKKKAKGGGRVPSVKKRKPSIRKDPKRVAAAKRGWARRHTKEVRTLIANGLHGKKREDLVVLHALVENNDPAFLQFLAFATEEGLSEKDAKDLWYSPD